MRNKNKNKLIDLFMQVKLDPPHFCTFGSKCLIFRNMIHQMKVSDIPTGKDQQILSFVCHHV